MPRLLGFAVSTALVVGPLGLLAFGLTSRPLVVGEFGLTYPNLVDEGGRVAVEYGVAGIPETIVVTADGRVSAEHSGPVTAERLVELARGAGLGDRIGVQFDAR